MKDDGGKVPDALDRVARTLGDGQRFRFLVEARRGVYLVLLWALHRRRLAHEQEVAHDPPPAELRENQRSEDCCPPYDVLDGMLESLIAKEKWGRADVAAGFDRNTVKRIETLIYASEYKRYQSAPGPRTSGAAFWLDRRYPIVNRWRDQS